MQLNVRTLLLGFVAGSLAVPIFHQAMVLILYLLGQTPNFPWNMSTFRGGPIPIPVIVNQMFWGGVWGVGFAAVGALIPIANTALRGLAFGLLGPWLLGNGILVPFFKSQPFFWGGQPSRMILGALINGAFGLGVALLYKALQKK